MTTGEPTIAPAAGAAPTQPPTQPPTRLVIRTATHVLVGTAEQAFTATRRAVGRAGALLTDLAERGAVVQGRARRRATSAGAGLTRAFAVNPIMNRVVDAQLERTVRPLVSIVLDDVLALLDNEPERIQTLIRGQRDSIADDLVSRVRSGAVAGDTTIDRITARLLRRTAPAPPASAPPQPTLL